MTGGTGASRQRAHKAAVPVHGGIDGGRDPSQMRSSRRRTLHRVGRPLLFSPERFRGRDARARVSLNPREQVLSLCRDLGFAQPPGTGPLPRRERQRGSSDAGSLRLPHRLTAPRFTAEHRSPAGLRHRSWSSLTILQESKNTGKQESTRTDNPRPRRRRSRCLSACRLVRHFPSPCRPVKKGTPSA